MADLGLSVVRIGEFAWSRLEPEPGDLQFDWLDRAFEILGAAGLGIVLGTPTATPPRWMIERHPDMLALDAEGRPRGFGSRRHYCFSHHGYRRDAVRITELLARRYGKHPHLLAWQTDNEYGCHDTVLSYSEAAAQGFRDWLAQRYQSIDALNRAWGNVFWSMEYRDFGEIGLPNLTVTEPNPAHVMDFRRYSSDQVLAFNAAQVAVIRAHSSADISHNYMGGVTEFDHFEIGRQMDFATWDSYPLGFLQDRAGASDEDKRRYARQGDPDYQAFHHDLYRSVGQGRWWVMEQQPGPVNWAPFNTIPLPGMVRLWTWEAFAHGAEAVCYFRWRQAPFGQEQMHTGLLRPDNAPAPAFGEVEHVMADLEEWPEFEVERAEIAILFDYQSAWSWAVQPQGRDCNYLRLIFDLYRALRRNGQNIDILPPDTRDFTGYRLVLVPGLEMMPEGLAEAIAASGAVSCFGPRTGSKTRDFSIPSGLPPDVPGIDGRVLRVETLPSGMLQNSADGGGIKSWREEFETEMTELFRDTAGWPIIAGHGNLHYLTGWPDDGLADRLIGMLCDKAGIKVHPMPPGLRMRRTSSVTFLFNYGDQAVDYAGGTIPPASVVPVPKEGGFSS